MHITKYTIASALLGLSLLGCHQGEDLAQSQVPVISSADTHHDSSVMPGTLRVLLSPELGNRLALEPGQDGLRSGNKELDEYLRSIGASSMRRVFPHAGKYEGRTRREGLHLWYDITFDESVPVPRAIGAARRLPGVVLTEEIHMPYTSDTQARTLSFDSTPRATEAPFNDGGLPLQWHYNNAGGKPYYAEGADINLYEAWKIETGKPNVVVAIVDGGIDIEHEDLKDNLYVNVAERDGVAGVDDDSNGYIDDIHGYNFVDMSPNIAAHRHGTHVAGTVGARTGNGKGVAGVAGGNGKEGSGVRLLSCQIFMTVDGASQGTPNSPQAIKYGADAGANISQNSWGYRYPGPKVIPASLKAAIDYFIKYAGCDDQGEQLPGSPMKGGVVLFAAGNDYVDHPVQPGPYEPVIAVASHTPEGVVADYSNRGDWVDIIAPGGSSYYAGGEVLSTLPGSKYGYLEGTSMACPHVSGVAALVLSKYGGPGYTAADLRSAILNAVSRTSVDEVNPKYAGRLGLGYLDAAKAFGKRTHIAPEAVTQASVASTLSGLELSIRATRDADDLGVAAYYDVYQSTSPLEQEKDLTAEGVVRRELVGHRTAVGELVKTVYTGLKSNTLYYFAVVARDRWDNASAPYFFSGRTASNQAPVITLEDSNPLRLAGSMQRELRINVSDPEGQNWSYQLSGQTEGVILTRDANGFTMRLRAIAPVGQHELKLDVTDAFGATTILKLPFEIYGNHAPRFVLDNTPIIIPLSERGRSLKLSELFVDDDHEPLQLSVQVLRGNVRARLDDHGELALSAATVGVSTISLVATDPAGATAKALVELRFVQNAFVQALYPMPATTQLNVQLASTLTAARLEVYTTTGQRVLAEDYSFAVGQSRLVKLNIASVLPGTYVLHVLSDGVKHTQTFVKR